MRPTCSLRHIIRYTRRHFHNQYPLNILQTCFPPLLRLHWNQHGSPVYGHTRNLRLDCHSKLPQTFYPPSNTPVRVSLAQSLLRTIAFKFKHALLKRINDMGILVLIIPLMLPPVRHMYMPVEKKFRLILLHQRTEYLKPLMGKVPPVV